MPGSYLPIRCGDASLEFNTFCWRKATFGNKPKIYGQFVILFSGIKYSRVSALFTLASYRTTFQRNGTLQRCLKEREEEGLENTPSSANVKLRPSSLGRMIKSKASKKDMKEKHKQPTMCTPLSSLYSIPASSTHSELFLQILFLPSCFGYLIPLTSFIRNTTLWTSKWDPPFFSLWEPLDGSEPLESKLLAECKGQTRLLTMLVVLGLTRDSSSLGILVSPNKQKNSWFNVYEAMDDTLAMGCANAPQPYPSPQKTNRT